MFRSSRLDEPTVRALTPGTLFEVIVQEHDYGDELAEALNAMWLRVLPIQASWVERQVPKRAHSR